MYYIVVSTNDVEIITLYMDNDQVNVIALFEHRSYDRIVRPMSYDRAMLSPLLHLLADDEDEAAGPGGRPHAQHKSHEDLRALRIQLLRRQLVQVLA